MLSSQFAYLQQRAVLPPDRLKSRALCKAMHVDGRFCLWLGTGSLLRAVARRGWFCDFGGPVSANYRHLNGGFKNYVFNQKQTYE